MRKKILNNNINPLEEPVTVAGIMEGEVKIPDEVKSFFRIMYTGSDSENDLTIQKEGLVESSAADTVYACSGGKQLTGKHLSLGVTAKAMTGSRRTVTLLNKFGHCATNETLRRIEMGMESTISETSSIVPSHIQKRSDLSTGLAWDNFDINRETPSDADTIHHTYGICYQNIDNNKNAENIMEHTCNAIGTKSVCYMKHIQFPPNRVDVVRETLKRSQAVSRECRQMYTIVTYDLAIAKIAKQIQSEDFPQFDDVYIMFGAFHIILNIFFSVGKIIEGSGGPYVLSEAKIVAPGSINQFPKGKMYNR